MERPEIPMIQIEKSVIMQIRERLQSDRIEQGCLVGAGDYLNRIDHFVLVPGRAEHDRFVPDPEAVNREIARWSDRGICFCGFFHSHPEGAGFLSCADHVAIERWVLAAGLPFLCFGVVDREANLRVYLAKEGCSRKVSVYELRETNTPHQAEYTNWRWQYA